MRITSLISPCLPHSGLFGPSLGLNFLKGVDFSYLYHLFVLVLPLPFMIGKIKSKRLGGWGEGGVEAWSGLPSLAHSPQVGTLAALGKLISACAESPFLQEQWCHLGCCLIGPKESG